MMKSILMISPISKRPISKDTLIIGFKPLINKLEENEKIYNKITTDIYKGTICGSLISCYSEWCWRRNTTFLKNWDKSTFKTFDEKNHLIFVSESSTWPVSVIIAAPAYSSEHPKPSRQKGPEMIEQAALQHCTAMQCSAVQCSAVQHENAGSRRVKSNRHVVGRTRGRGWAPTCAIWKLRISNKSKFSELGEGLEGNHARCL